MCHAFHIARIHSDLKKKGCGGIQPPHPCVFDYLTSIIVFVWTYADPALSRYTYMPDASFSASNVAV